MELASETFRTVSCQPTRQDYEEFFSTKLDLGVRKTQHVLSRLDRTCHFDLESNSERYGIDAGMSKQGTVSEKPWHETETCFL